MRRAAQRSQGEVCEGYTLKMGAVSNVGQKTEPVADREARFAKLVTDVDAIAVTLPRAFAKSRLETLRILAQDVMLQSQAIKVAMSLDRPIAQILEIVEALKAAIIQLRIMSSRTRTEQGTQLALLLIEKLTASLCAELRNWQSQD